MSVIQKLNTHSRVLKPSSYTWVFTLAAAILYAVLTPSSAMAYVGPGVGISVLSALWAVILAVFFMLGGLIAWPIRALMRRRRSASAKAQKLGLGKTDS